jgi:predicted alpha/beta hydrolase family esterase
MAKRAFIIHGWEGRPDHGWYTWLRKELEGKGFEAVALAMPDTEKPKMNEWVEHLKETVGEPDKDCYFIGHSLGCITILRYLESLKESQKIGGTVLVAGFVSHLGYEEIGSFFTTFVDWEKVKSHCDKFVAIHSDNDPYVSTHYGDIFKEELGAQVILRHDMKHFAKRDGFNELPDALDAVLKISG